MFVLISNVYVLMFDVSVLILNVNFWIIYEVYNVYVIKNVYVSILNVYVMISNVYISNKAGYTATSLACGWAGAVFEVTLSFRQEHRAVRPKTAKKQKKVK